MTREYQEKLSHLRDLIHLSRVDGFESTIESCYIDTIAVRLGVDREDLEKIKNNEFKFPFSPPKYEYEIIPQFHRIVLLMGIDRMIYKEELKFCTDLGLKMGLNLSAVNEILEKMIYYPNNIIPADELECIFKRYCN